MGSLRQLPSVDQLLQTSNSNNWIASFGRNLTTEAIRSTLEWARSEFKAGKDLPERERLIQEIGQRLEKWSTSSLQPVIYASGVILQTNLGRAPLSNEANLAVQEIAPSYSNLEYDLEKGKRGSRLVHAEELLSHLTGSQKDDSAAPSHLDTTFRFDNHTGSDSNVDRAINLKSSKPGVLMLPGK